MRKNLVNTQSVLTTNKHKQGRTSNLREREKKKVSVELYFCHKFRAACKYIMDGVTHDGRHI